MTEVSSNANFNLRIKNPCIDPAYVTIFELLDLPSQAYILQDMKPDGLIWTHIPFTLSPDPIATSLCGPLTYTATFNGFEINESSVPLRYDSTMNQFGIFSNDFNMLGDHVYTLKASLEQYPDIESTEVSGLIQIQDPCPNPQSVTASKP